MRVSWMAAGPTCLSPRTEIEYERSLTFTTRVPMSRHRTRKPRRIAHERRPRHPSPGPSALGARVLAPAAARRTPGQARARELVDALVEAAAQLLVERGYEGASTNAIADRAGVSVGWLYQ